MQICRTCQSERLFVHAREAQSMHTCPMAAANCTRISLVTRPYLYLDLVRDSQFANASEEVGTLSRAHMARLDEKSLLFGSLGG
jgi:hypothetical protein